MFPAPSIGHPCSDAHSALALRRQTPASALDYLPGDVDANVAARCCRETLLRDASHCVGGREQLAGGAGREGAHVKCKQALMAGKHTDLLILPLAHAHSPFAPVPILHSTRVSHRVHQLQG